MGFDWLNLCESLTDVMGYCLTWLVQHYSISHEKWTFFDGEKLDQRLAEAAWV